MNEQVVIPDRSLTLSDTMTLGDVFAKSGFFTDSRQAAQAVVKILAGRELGFPPVMSMTGINIVLGKVAVGSGLMAAMVKHSKRYDYRIKVLTDTACTLAFMDGGQIVYESSFTLEDAKRAGLLGKDMWSKYPRNMLFARALSNGARFVCPDLVTGVYTPDELGLTVDGDGNAVIDVPAATITTEQASTAQAATATTTNGHERPYTAAQLKNRFAAIVVAAKSDPMKEGIRGLVAHWLERPFSGLDAVKMEQNRHSVVRYLTGKGSLNDCSWQELRALKAWLGPTEDAGGAWSITLLAALEAQAVITQVMRDAGQTDLFGAEAAEDVAAEETTNA